MSCFPDDTRTRLAAQLLAVALSAAAWDVSAQELEPRDHTNTPVGLNFLIGGYAYGNGSAVAIPSLPLENAKLRQHAAAEFSST